LKIKTGTWKELITWHIVLMVGNFKINFELRYVSLGTHELTEAECSFGHDKCNITRLDFPSLGHDISGDV
jgi:hypothetical protein